jgi:AcrR family transcriptional regulator
LGRGVRAKQKAETRVSLKRAALACFSARGFRQTQVGDIARRAKVAHGTFYVHFETKEALLDELVAEFHRELVADLERAWHEHGAADPSKTARRLAEVCLDHWSQERELLAAFAERAGGSRASPTLRDGISPPVATFLADRLRENAALAGHELAEAELVAHALIGLWTSVGLRYLFGPRIAKKTAVELLAKLSLGALAAVLLAPGAIGRRPEPGPTTAAGAGAKACPWCGR